MVAVFAGGASASAGYSTSSDYQKAMAGSWVRLDGRFQVVVTDFDESSETSYFLNLGDLRIPLHFASNPPTNLLTGTRVRVRGRKQRDGSLTLASKTSVKGGSGGSTTTTSGGPLPNTLGAQSTLIILVNFQDDPTNQPYTAASAQSVVFQSGNGSVNDFFNENSYGQTWLTGQVVGWYTIPVSSTSCDTASIASYAKSAASSAGFTLSAYTRYVYAFPWSSACGWPGMSEVGTNPSQTWINGNNLDLHTIVHELGHAFGLMHSHLLDCGTSATIGSNCTVDEYGDILDTMGSAQPSAPHYNAFQKERLGWLNYAASPAIATIRTPGTYTISAYEPAGQGPNALKIAKSTDPATGAKTWYYLEARQALGFDAFLVNGSCGPCYTQNETSGVLFHLGTDGNAGSADLLDMTPSTPSYGWYYDPSLAVGQSFEDAGAGVAVTTVAVSSSQATVNVEFMAGLSLTAGSSNYSPGQSVSLMATASFGGSPVANTTISFSITTPSGAVVSGTAKTGSNGTAVYTYKLNSGVSSGTYNARAAATINGSSGGAATSFTVS